MPVFIETTGSWHSAVSPWLTSYKRRDIRYALVDAPGVEVLGKGARVGSTPLAEQPPQLASRNLSRRTQPLGSLIQLVWLALRHLLWLALRSPAVQRTLPHQTGGSFKPSLDNSC